jgi:glyoxylase-like metal-dependent hydrolase (beta-lactamase superfamily II)
MLKRAATLLLLSCSFASARDAAAPSLESAAKALGATNLTSIQYSGSGSAFTLGQNVNPTTPWPKVALKSFTRTVNYAGAAYLEETVRVTPAGEQRQTQAVSGKHAWNVAANGNATAALPAVAERVTQIWITPHGFLKAALQNRASAKSKTEGGKKVTVVSFTGQGKYKMSGVIAPDGTVARVETFLENPVLGDMAVETTYSDYKDFGAVKFPTRIVQKQGGFPMLELAVTDVKANVPLQLSVPPGVASATLPPVTVESQKLSDGVWYLTGGSHHSVVVEFKDHVVVIEGPLSAERSKAVMAEVKKLVPSKPLRYLVNTHHHFDHSGGLRAYASSGVTIVTHEINKPFYARAFKGKFQTVADKRVLTDGSRTLELHVVKGSPHHDGILMGYLPKEKLLVEVDVYTPLAPNAPQPQLLNPATVNLYENVERLKLDVTQVAALHGRLVPIADLQRAAGKAR